MANLLDANAPSLEASRPEGISMDTEALLANLDQFVASVKAADVDDVAGDLIDNLEGHLASVRMRLGNIAERISNNQKEA